MQMTKENTDPWIGAAFYIRCAECAGTEWIVWSDEHGNRMSHPTELWEICADKGWRMRPIDGDEDELEPVCPKCGGGLAEKRQSAARFEDPE